MADKLAIDQLTDEVIGSAIKVHRHFGPGLLHSVYLLCLAQELLERGLPIEVEKPIAVSYGGVAAACAFRVDLMVSEQVIVEVKCVEVLAGIHCAQMITYLKLTGCPVGLLINFNVQVLKNGVKRIVNNLRDGDGKLV
jgi:GxxExxY protein